MSQSAEAACRTLTSLSENRGQTSGTRLVSAVTIAEKFTDERISDLIEHSNIREGAFGRALLSESVDSLTNSWPERKKWLNHGFEVPLDREPSWLKMNVVIDIRNAIIHGHGSLTIRQIKNPLAAMKLRNDARKSLGLHIEAGRMLLTPQADASAIAIASDYVLLLDDLVNLRLKM